MRPRWWQWPTVLSLDAPAVALAWQALVAREAEVSVSGAARFVLGAAVWMAYTADRWIEGWRLPPDRVRTQRHAFSQRARWPVAGVWVVVYLAAVGVAWRGLTARQFWTGAGLLPLVGAYLFSHQFVHRRSRWRLPKEICVALLLAGGIGVLLWPSAEAEAQQRMALAVPVVLFALLAFANCALIAVWERPVDAAHGEVSLARQFARGDKVARAAGWGALASGIFAMVCAPTAYRSGASAALSAAFLLLLDRAEPRLTARLARVLADAVLLTPLLFLR